MSESIKKHLEKRDDAFFYTPIEKTIFVSAGECAMINLLVEKLSMEHAFTYVKTMYMDMPHEDVITFLETFVTNK